MEEIDDDPQWTMTLRQSILVKAVVALNITAKILDNSGNPKEAQDYRDAATAIDFAAQADMLRREIDG